jgi:PAS domain S-box-containing protein
MLSELAVPIVVDAKSVAVLNAESIRLDAFSTEDQGLLETLAAHVGSGMQRLKRAQELEVYSKHLEKLVEERTRKLHQSEERYRSIVQNIPAIVWTSDENGNTVLITPNVEEVYGYTRGEILSGGMGVLSRRIHPDDTVKVKGGYNALFTDGREFNVEYRYQRPDGKWLWLQDRANIVYEKNGIRYTDGVTTNITEHKRIEEDLRAAREELEYVLSANPAVVYTGKPFPDHSDFFATYISKNIVSLLGFEASELTGRSGAEFWISRLPPEDYQRYQAGVPLLWKDGHHTFEYRFLHKDGSYRWIREEERAILDSEGQVRDIVGYWTDITEHKRLEEDLLKSQRLAVIGETAAMVAHDLRNPLQGITTAIYLLKQQSLTTKQRDEVLQLIQDSIDYSESIVRDLSAYSAEIDLKLADATPKSIIEEALAGARISRKVTVRNVSEESPLIKIDPDRMKRVLINLIENAMDAMPQGGTLTVSSRKIDANVEIVLTDTGVGMPKRILQNPWKPLQTTKAKGLGLGLAICKRIVDAHDGSISVKSRISEGTTVTVRLPIKINTVEVKER